MSRPHPLVNRLVVTGGAGFIGSHLVRALLDRSSTATDVEVEVAANEVVVLDIDGTQVADNARLPKTMPGLQFVRGSVLDRDLVHDLLRDASCAIHLAALNHTDESFVSPAEFATANVAGTAAVLDAARHHGTGKVVIVSSDHVYGAVESNEICSVSTLRPRSPSGASKAAADLLALSYHHSFGTPVSIVRPSNVFGSWQETDKAMSRFIGQLLRGQPAPVYGDGSDRRDWIGVNDVVRAIITVTQTGLNGGVYDIQSGWTPSNRELVELIATQLDIAVGRAVRLVADTRGRDGALTLDTEPLRSLGWRPDTDPRAALRSTVEWYDKHRWWWEPRHVSTQGHPAPGALASVRRQGRG